MVQTLRAGGRVVEFKCVKILDECTVHSKFPSLNECDRNENAYMDEWSDNRR